MMGHRGVRLGITYPEVTEMQVRAILEAAAELIKEGKKVLPEIMVPVDLRRQRARRTRRRSSTACTTEVRSKYGREGSSYLYGTMIEIPRACLLADKIAETAEFFSFGTNDLTQMTFGFSRDDIGGFLPDYLEKKHPAGRPVPDHRPGGRRPADRDGGIKHGRATRPDLKVGICGEHGGDPASRRVLPPGRAELRELLAVPRADRAVGGGAGAARPPAG